MSLAWISGARSHRRYPELPTTVNVGCCRCDVAAVGVYLEACPRTRYRGFPTELLVTLVGFTLLSVAETNALWPGDGAAVRPAVGRLCCCR